MGGDPTVADFGLATNAAQAQRWNGASGRSWIEDREQHLAEHQYLTQLFGAAGNLARRACA